MFKPTPNPPETDPTSPYESLDYHLKPPIPKDTKRKPSTIYHVGTKVDNETLLVNACETLASASGDARGAGGEPGAG
jgi:hypothetical protein